MQVETPDDSALSLQQQSPLFQLPAELRLNIYQYALVELGDTRIQLRGLAEPPLFSTCRLIREESSTVYFSSNRFVLTVVIPAMAFSPKPTPREHRVVIPPWIQEIERRTPIRMRDVKVEIDHAWKWVVVTMAQSEHLQGRVDVVEAWLHNGRMKLPLGEMHCRVKDFVDSTMEQKPDIEKACAGLNYRDVIEIASKMLPNWAGVIVPA